MAAPRRPSMPLPPTWRRCPRCQEVVVRVACEDGTTLEVLGNAQTWVITGRVTAEHLAIVVPSAGLPVHTCPGAPPAPAAPEGDPL